MIKKALVAVMAAGALSIPLAGMAWADQPDDPGAGNKGVPDRAKAAIESLGGSVDGFQSGNSSVVAPGTAFSTGAKVDGVNTPEGYGRALNAYWEGQAAAGNVNLATVPGYPFGRTVPGSVTKQFTNGATQK